MEVPLAPRAPSGLDAYEDSDTSEGTPSPKFGNKGSLASQAIKARQSVEVEDREEENEQSKPWESLALVDSTYKSNSKSVPVSVESDSSSSSPPGDGDELVEID